MPYHSLRGKTAGASLAVLEAPNLGGYLLALEVGYARALDKRIIYIDEKSLSDPNIGRYLGMARACADVTFQLFKKGLTS